MIVRRLHESATIRRKSVPPEFVLVVAGSSKSIGRNSIIGEKAARRQKFEEENRRKIVFCGSEFGIGQAREVMTYHSFLSEF